MGGKTAYTSVAFDRPGHRSADKDLVVTDVSKS